MELFRHLNFVLFCASAYCFTSASTVAAASGETAATVFVRTKHDQVKVVLKLPTATPDQVAARDKKLDGVLEDFLDYATLSKRSLGEHWEGRTEAERKEFVGLLTQLIQRNYRRSLTDTMNYKVTYLGESPSPEGVIVATKAKSTTNKRTESVEIDYTISKVNSAERVVDITTDGVSIVKNYRSQFNRIIKKDGWDGLIKKMATRLKEGASEI